MAKREWQSVIKQSWELRREKKLREAELVLHEGLADYSPGSFAHNQLRAHLADVLLRQGKTAEARTLALEVLALEPSQVIALTVLGLAALEQSATAEAVENLTRAYALGPNAYRAGRLARALELDGQREKALALLQEALQQYPADGYLLRQYRTLQEKALPAAEAGNDPLLLRLAGDEEAHLPYAEQLKEKLRHLDPAEAAQQLRKIIKVGRRKENPHLHLLLGDCLRRAGHDAEAAEAYEKARELDPGNLYALSQLLFCYRRLGEKEKAWPLFKLLLLEKPGDKAAKTSFIKDAVELGRVEEAAAFFAELLERYPHRKELFGSIRRLKKTAAAREDKR